MKNIGWLGTKYGLQNQLVEVDDLVSQRLKDETRLIRTMQLGTHECEFCSGSIPAVGNGEIHVYADSGETYSAPALVCHYVELHRYAPPQEFVDALLNRNPLTWDSRADILRDHLATPDANPTWRLNALIDLTRWEDERADRAIVASAHDEELELVASYELGIALAAVWIRSRAIDGDAFRSLYPDVQSSLRGEYSRRGIRFPLPR
ncbi:hypothetical protein ACIHFE_05610 [Streptomyces sp. NPDC052396]|uniref:DUF7919 family protein n=1 Tax=Streptomyces sp. NPDC052396 TaxID=3365689 RepID=UPI0037D74E2F